MTPTRILDTRVGTGATAGAVAARGTVELQVEGVAGIPASGVSAVVLNVTVTAPTAKGYLTVYPAGLARPTTSDVNYVLGQSRAHSSIAGVGTNGRVEFYNGSGGTAQFVADVSGYYVTGSSTQNGAFTPLPPRRVLDTRSSAPVGSFKFVKVPVAGHDGIPADFDGTVVFNLTVTQVQAAGYVALDYVGVGGQSINFQAGQTNSNLVVAPTDGTGRVPITNHAQGTVEVIADVVGYFSAGPPNRAGYLASLLPYRLLDTRQTGPSVPAGGSIDVTVTAAHSVPAGISAAAVDLTAVTPSAGGYLSVYPQGTSRPGTSALNFSHLTIANLVVVPVASNGEITIYNGSSRPVNVLVDVSADVGAVPGVLDWSAPQPLTTSLISGFSCTSATFCLEVDQHNAVHRFNGTSWVSATSIPPAVEDGIYTLSCASSTFCVAIAGTATAYVWHGSSWTAAPTRNGENLYGVACGSPTFCVGLTVGTGGEDVATFDGTSWSLSRRVFAENQNLSDVSCVGASFCIVVGADSNTVARWDGTSWTESSALLTGPGVLQDVSCASTTFCAVSAYNRDFYFDGTTWSGADDHPGTSGAVGTITCASADLCLQGNGLVAERVDGTWTSAFPLGFDDEVSGYACPSAQFCFALDGTDIYTGTPRPA